jgi:hypothetical protein
VSGDDRRNTLDRDPPADLGALDPYVGEAEPIGIAGVGDLGPSDEYRTELGRGGRPSSGRGSAGRVGTHEADGRNGQEGEDRNSWSHGDAPLWMPCGNKAVDW